LLDAVDNCIGAACNKIGEVVDSFRPVGKGVPYIHQAPSAPSTMKPRAASPGKKTD
jgi:hypothetical protein